MEEGTETRVDEGEYFIYIEKFWPTEYNNRPAYDVLLEELRPHLKQGEITVYGQTIPERRLTCLISHQDGMMTYSGRSVQPVKPIKGSFIDVILRTLNTSAFREHELDMFPQLKKVFEEQDRSGSKLLFNAIFVNWYRPPSETDKIDYLGIHADDERSLKSKSILSLTFCEEGGAKLFKFHNKRSEEVIWEHELENGAGVWMLPGCQDKLKHSVSDRKTTLKRKKIVGGRLSLTARLIDTGESSVEKPIVKDEPMVLFCKKNGLHGYLSNWYASPFNVGDREYHTVEHYMMFFKASYMGDMEIAELVLKTISPAEVKKLGRKVKNYDDKLWAEKRFDVVYDGNLAKFRKYPALAMKLLNTGNAIIAEAADYDKIFGIGLSASDPRAKDPKTWLGQNLLGQILMKVRDTLRANTHK